MLPVGLIDIDVFAIRNEFQDLCGAVVFLCNLEQKTLF